MAQIKFSHHYQKMPNGFEHSRLLEVLIANESDLSSTFINYDTFYNTGFYPLPSGKVLILLLRAEPERYPVALWTTIRSWTPEKEVYYKSKRGEMFDCVVV